MSTHALYINVSRQNVDVVIKSSVIDGNWIVGDLNLCDR
uniref:Uncharacterized protein n=1 Tax=Arundo donax TaxID=35708 RepID=A0A0A9B7J5_ARUDO